MYTVLRITKRSIVTISAILAPFIVCNRIVSAQGLGASASAIVNVTIVEPKAVTIESVQVAYGFSKLTAKNKNNSVDKPAVNYYGVPSFDDVALAGMVSSTVFGSAEATSDTTAYAGLSVGTDAAGELDLPAVGHAEAKLWVSVTLRNSRDAELSCTIQFDGVALVNIYGTPVSAEAKAEGTNGFFHTLKIKGYENEQKVEFTTFQAATIGKNWVKNIYFGFALSVDVYHTNIIIARNDNESQSEKNKLDKTPPNDCVLPRRETDLVCV